MRYELSDYEWSVIKPMLPNKPRGVQRVNDRRVLRSTTPTANHCQYWAIPARPLSQRNRWQSGRWRRIGNRNPTFSVLCLVVAQLVTCAET
jgi:transposase